MTIKKLTKENIDQMKDLFHYCFYEPDNWSWDSENYKTYFSLLNFDNCLGYFIDEELASTYVILDFRFFVRKVLMDMGGIASVTTKPQYRRQGLVKKLAVESLKLMRKNKQYISVLFPFKFSYYRMFGYENCADIPSVVSPPENILLPKDFNQLQIKEISHKDTYKIAESMRKEFGNKYNTVLFSSDKAWRFHHLRKQDKFFAIYQNEKAVGYFITSLKKCEGPWNIRLNITNHLMATEDARLTMLEYIYKHRDQNKEFKIWFYGDEKVIDYFNDLWSDGMNYQITGGPMFRLIDIKEALKLLNFNNAIDFEFTLRITDTMAPWNEEPIKIQIKEGKATITKHSGFEFDLETDIKAFTQLFVGYRSIYDLNRINKVNVNKNLMKNIDHAFPIQTTRLTTGF